MQYIYSSQMSFYLVDFLFDASASFKLKDSDDFLFELLEHSFEESVDFLLALLEDSLEDPADFLFTMSDDSFEDSVDFRFALHADPLGDSADFALALLEDSFELLLFLSDDFPFDLEPTPSDFPFELARDDCEASEAELSIDFLFDAASFELSELDLGFSKSAASSPSESEATTWTFFLGECFSTLSIFLAMICSDASGWARYIFKS